MPALRGQGEEGAGAVQRFYAIAFRHQPAGERVQKAGQEGQGHLRTNPIESMTKSESRISNKDGKRDFNYRWVMRLDTRRK